MGNTVIGTEYSKMPESTKNLEIAMLRREATRLEVMKFFVPIPPENHL
jgi:hypothetical protein